MAGNALKIIVGLGNPGAEYARTRHNAGFWLVDELARRHGGTFRSEGKHQAELARVRIGGEEVWLMKPMTFMNRSGGPVSSVLGFYKLSPPQMLVAHDEIDLPSGTVRLKEAGGHGGHNGLRDSSRRRATPSGGCASAWAIPGRKTKSSTSCSRARARTSSASSTKRSSPARMRSKRCCAQERRSP